MDTVPILKELFDEVNKITKQIHADFGSECLLVMHDDLPLSKRLAIWSQCNILLSSTLKDGLSLPPLEYVTVKSIMGDFKNSQMMLSEYGGCTYSFSGFYSFNSFDLSDF
jgi:trehalose-6-phosphate synthase